MAPASALGITRPDRLSELISYIRYAWGRESSSVSDVDVKRVQKLHESRKTPWTDAELKALIDSVSYQFSNLLPVDCFGDLILCPKLALEKSG